LYKWPPTDRAVAFVRLALGVMTLIGLGGCSKPTVEITMPIQSIESQLSERFPMLTSGFGEPGAAVKAVLEVPQLKLEESSQRISFISRIRAQIEPQPGVEYRGNVSVSAKPEFRLETGGLHLIDPNVQTADFGQLPEEYHEAMRNAIKVAFAQYFAKQPLVSLSNEDIQQLKDADSLLEIIVQNEQLIVRSE
jgi:hypothetical protein